MDSFTMNNHILPFDLSSTQMKRSDDLAKQLKGAIAEKSDPKIEKAAKEFESVYLGQMLEHMFAGIETDPMFGGGSSEKIFKSMQIQEYAKILTEKGGIGIADAMKAELINMQAQEVQ